MVKQYPYKLYYIDAKAADDQPDQNGGWGDGAASEPEYKFLCMCRDEQKTGRKYDRANGQDVSFTAVLQCPRKTKALAEGIRVKVIGLNGEVRLKETVLYSEESQMHTRIWV